LEEVPEKNWYNLMCQRAMFVKAHLPHDCRCLVQFVADAERMYGPLGFKGADDFIARGLKLVPEEIRIAVEWLKISKPQEAVAYEWVLGKHGGNRRVDKQADNVSLQYGNSVAYLIARLKRDFPEIAKRLAAGEFKSVRAAAMAAGLIAEPTPFEQIEKSLRKFGPQLSPDELQRLRTTIDQLIAALASRAA
jgi:hypothetical protein